MIDIEQLKKDYIIDLDAFELAKRNYYAFCIKLDNPNFSVEKSKEAYKNLCDKFDHILRICANEAKVAETADIWFDTEKDNIPKVAFSTHATNFNFTVGLFREFYIMTDIRNSHNLKLMKDEFWGLLFNLSEIGKFYFKESEKPTKEMRAKYPQLFNKKGNYFKLLRNYFLYEIEYASIRSIGYISVSWSNDTPFEKLIVNFCEAFRLMYQLNLLLWKEDNKMARF